MIPFFTLLSCATETIPAPEPGELVAGLAEARIPAPLGIGTAGNGPFDAPSSNSPFADIYPATTRLHGHPEISVVALSRGAGFEVVFVRVDAVGMFQQLRRAVVLELEERLGRSMDDALVLGATHTHSGPGRVIDGGGIFDLIADSFFPEYYQRLVDTIADTVEAALADAAPARVAHAMAASDDAHSDRRCEDGGEDEDGYQNPTLPVLAVERDGRIEALVMSYAIHGTVLGIDELTLSQDVSGAIEEAVEDRFDHPVQALLFQSWGADMAPGNPDVASTEVDGLPEGYAKMARIGSTVADAVESVTVDLDWDEAPEIRMHTHRHPIDRTWIGYDDETFPYEYGAVYCAADEDCDPATSDPDLDQQCVPFNEDYPAPNQTLMTAGVIGGLHLQTFPGEPGTRLAERVLDDIAAQHGDLDVMFLGYAQDYLGYSILEDDWWQGGYEASGALWGPQQGEYLVGRAVDTFRRMFDRDTFDTLEPDHITPFSLGELDDWPVEGALEVGTFQIDANTGYGPDEIVSVTVNGTDPWLGAPVATLQSADGTPISRPGGQPVTSEGYAFWLDLVPDPAYDDAAHPTTRTFAWTVSMPVTRPVDGALPAGDYRLSIAIPTQDGPVTVTSADFSVN